MTTSSQPIPAPRVRESLLRLKQAIGRVIKGKDEVVDKVIMALLAGGHVLIEDLPGLGKTTLAYSLARSLDCAFSRIQFTSDLLPSDVIGVSIYDDREKAFIFRKGPIFAPIVLADEINRTTPKTQSSLLEVMDRAKVSVDGQTHTIGAPFMVFATQNPVDYEGTFPLPESQMDRFLFRLKMGYPAFADELDILRNNEGRRGYDAIAADPVLSRQEIIAFQQHTPLVFVEDSVRDYMLRIVASTRQEPDFQAGISTRGALALQLASQACALYNGRAFVIPEDVTSVVKPVFVHRLTLRRQTADALEERETVEGIIDQLLTRIAPPA